MTTTQPIERPATDPGPARPAPRLLIVLYMYPWPGGISSIVENMAGVLEGRYEVHVAAAVGLSGRSQLGLPPERFHAISRSKALRPTLMPTSLLFSVRTARRLRSLVRELEPEAVILQDALFLSVPGAIATRGTGSKLAVMDHGVLTNQLDPNWQRMTRRRMTPLVRLAYRAGFALDAPWRHLRWRLGLRAADAAWYVGEELEPYFQRAGKRARRYSQIVPTDFRPPTPDERAIARDELGVGEETVFNVVGRIDGEKGLDLILDAFERVRRGGEPTLLAIAGTGSLEGWVRQEVERRGLGDAVRMTGPLDRAGVRALHHASDFHVYAGTISCGLSICLLEAMACEVIPIVSDIPAAQRDLVGDAGWVFPAGDARALEECLRGALSLGEDERARRRELIPTQLAATPDPALEDLIDDLVAA